MASESTFFVVLYAELGSGEDACAPVPRGVFREEEEAKALVREIVRDRWLGTGIQPRYDGTEYLPPHGQLFTREIHGAVAPFCDFVVAVPRGEVRNRIVRQSANFVRVDPRSIGHYDNEERMWTSDNVFFAYRAPHMHVEVGVCYYQPGTIGQAKAEAGPWDPFKAIDQLEDNAERMDALAVAHEPERNGLLHRAQEALGMGLDLIRHCDCSNGVRGPPDERGSDEGEVTAGDYAHRMDVVRRDLRTALGMEPDGE